MKPELVSLFKEVYNKLDHANCLGEWCGSCPFMLLKGGGCGVNRALELLDGTRLGKIMEDDEV